MDKRLLQEKRLERDIAEILERHRHLLECMRAGTDAHRMMAIISVTHGAEQHLPRSLPRLLEQTRALGLALDLLLGCNNGFTSPALVEFIEQQSGCRVVHGFCAKVAPNQPAPILDQSGTPLIITAGAPEEDRCFLIHQRCAPNAPTDTSAGKIRMLSDLYGWIEQSIAAGWAPPQLLLACDAESEFDLTAPWTAEGHGDPGLGLLIARMDAEPNLQLLGTRNRFVVFETDEDGIRRPRPDWPVPSIQLYMNLVHTRAEGFMWLPGGGTLGRTETLTALYSFIADRYPGGRIEDTMATVLAHASGFMLDLESQVSSINRCAPISNNTEATKQMDRYLSGQKDLESKFGQTVAIYVPMSIWSIIETGWRLAVKEIFGAQSIERFFNMSFNALRILGSLPRFLRIRYAATNANSEDPGVSVSW